ncbi:MAG: hypothetical protein A2X56_06105 [Nitrospirae bacterium GWC2_57_13]|jgi:nitrate/nitrite transport system substrate-binding protein|nr:MAG: hypothetical protein A2X56_06105 [Nitrospirae bacterium GWC2_57_13]
MRKQKSKQTKQGLAGGTDNADWTRRKFIARVGGAFLSAGALGTGLLLPDAIMASVATGREVTIGTFGPSHCSATFVYARLKGLFQGGLTVNLVNYPDMGAIAKDLMSGKLDFGQLVVPLAFAMHTGSKPFTTKTPVVIPQIAGTNGSALVIRSGAPIAKPADFKGKTVASHNALSVNHLINVMFFESNGLVLDKDVKYKQVDLERVGPALKAGEIDAFVMPEPANALAEHSGSGKIYLLSKYIWPNHPCCALVCRKDFYDKNASLVADVTRSMTRAGLAINEAEDRESTIALLQSSDVYKFDKIPAPVLMSAFTPGRADFYPFPYQSSALIIIDIMKRLGLLAKDVNDKKLAGEVFLSGLSRKLMKEVGAEAPVKDHRMEKILGKIKTFGA